MNKLREILNSLWTLFMDHSVESEKVWSDSLERDSLERAYMRRM